MMDKGKVTEFVKTHKKEIAIAVGLTVVGIVVARMGIKLDAECEAEGRKILEALRKAEEAYNNAFDVGVLHDITKETRPDGYTMLTAIVNNMTPADLGRLGDDILRVDGITPETMVSAIVSFTVK